MKRALARFLMAAFTATPVFPAGAHAQLDRVAPAAGSTVHASPPRIELWFTERLEPAFSKVRVFARNGKPVDTGDAEVDRADARLLRAPLPNLAPGVYRVQWRVISVDAHVSEGEYTFTVAP